MTELPSHARVVIVGGGIIGCSVAYHLALRGETDVVLLERKQLTCGTTWHAAGLVGQLRATHNLTRLAQYTTDLFATLGARDGSSDWLSCPWLGQCGADGGALRGTEAWGLDGACVRAGGQHHLPGRRAGSSSTGPRRRLGRGPFTFPTTASPTRSTRLRHWPRALEPAGCASSRTSRSSASSTERRSSRRGRVDASSVRSAPMRSSTPRACGLGNWVIKSVRSCRCTQPSTSTSSPMGSTASRPTCRCCATRMVAVTSKRTPASCWSAGSSRSASRGA